MGFHTITLLMLGISLLLSGCAGADATAWNDRPIATRAPTGKLASASPPSAEPAAVLSTIARGCRCRHDDREEGG